MFNVGKTTVTKIHEMDLNGFSLKQLLPSLDENRIKTHPGWFPEGTVEDGRALMSVHSWLVRHDGMTILVDTGAGNGKSRPHQKALDHLDNPFLQRLAAEGVAPEAVDFVLHTHIHSDHVGWNTCLVDGQWQPTFRNATTICSRAEWDYGAALAESEDSKIDHARSAAGLGQPIRTPLQGTFEDSMMPLRSSGRLKLVEFDSREILPGIRFLPTPGHSIAHAAIELVADGETAIFGGDVMHHPVELYDADLVSAFCEFPGAARRSRQMIVEHASDKRALYFSSHFSRSSVGRIEAVGAHHKWIFS